MMTREQEDKLWKIMHQCSQNHEQGQQSFTANIKSGTVYVECRNGANVLVKTKIDNKENENMGTQMAMWNYLRTLDLDFDSIKLKTEE